MSVVGCATLAEVFAASTSEGQALVDAPWQASLCVVFDAAAANADRALP